MLVEAVVGEDPEPVVPGVVVLPEMKGFESEEIDACERSTCAVTLLFPAC